jgi:hypothetical protein
VLKALAIETLKVRVIIQPKAAAKDRADARRNRSMDGLPPTLVGSNMNVNCNCIDETSDYSSSLLRALSPGATWMLISASLQYLFLVQRLQA